MLGKLVTKSQRVIAHYLPFPCPSPPSRRFVPKRFVLDTLGAGFVVHDLHPRVRADHEHFSTMHHASMDEDDFACRDFAKAEGFCRRTTCRRPALQLPSYPRELFFRLASPCLSSCSSRSFSSLSSFLAATSVYVDCPFSADQELEHLLISFRSSFPSPTSCR